MKKLVGVLLGCALAAGPAQAVTLFGLLDTGELYASADAGATWTLHSTLPVRDAVALIAGESSAELLLASESGSIYASSDAGLTWTGVSTVSASDVVALGGASGVNLLLTASGSTYQSTDAGVTWPGVGTITASDIAGVTHLGDAWYALARTGGVYCSSDAGVTWTAAGAITTSEAVELAAYSGKLYAISASGDLYESDDHGRSFSAVSTLSHVGASALVSGDGELVAALETGEIATSGSATSWVWRGTINQLRLRALATDIPPTSVEPPGGMALALRGPYPNPARETVWLRLDLARQSTVTLRVYDIAGREVARPIARQLFPEGTLTRLWRPTGLRPGVYTVRATVDGAAVASRLVWLGGAN